MPRLSSSEISRLQAAISHARRKLKPFREQRARFIKQYVGKNYGENGTRDKVPVNLIELAVNVLGRQMAARSPQAFVSTPMRSLKPAAYKLQLATNRLAERIRLQRILRDTVVDALFMIGVAKVGMDHGQIPVEQSWRMSGMPYVERIDFDDFCFDIAASDWKDIHFAANDYVMTMDELKDHPAFDGPGMAKISPSELSGTNEEDGDERVETMSRGTDGPVETYKDIIRLRDVWLPKEKLLVTFAVEGTNEPLRETEWSGPADGPFKFLYYSGVPNNIMPLSPMAKLVDLHDLTNRLFRKMARQAERQKTILGVRRAASEDGSRILKASDGDVIGLDSPDAAREYSFGGADATTLALVVQLRDLFTYLAGNLNSLGGLSPQAQTLGQDKLMVANASKMVADMQDCTTDFARDILHDIAWYLFTDPLIELPLSIRITPDWEIPSSFSWEDQVGDFLGYNFQVEPYSMQHETPGQRMQALQQILQTIILPMMGLLQQAGITVNMEGLLRTVARYTNMTELEDLLVFNGPPLPPQPEAVGSQPPKMTHRTYERINRPGATQEGKDQALMMNALGIEQQPSETAQLGRTIG